jgi:hypothetical protein
MPKLKKLKLVALLGIALICFIFIFLPLLGHKWGTRHSISRTSVVALDKWERFKSEEGRFSIRFPGTPEADTNIVESKIGLIPVVSFYVWADIQTQYAVNYSDNPEPAKKLTTSQQFDAGMGGVENKLGKITSYHDFSFGTYPAREFNFTGRGKANFSGTVRLILASGRLYQIMVVFLTKDPHQDDFKVFFDSFSISTVGLK